MEVRFHRKFLKHYEKLPAKVKMAVEERIVLFSTNPFDAVLRNHALTGDWAGRRSINIMGDYRAIYKKLDKNTALFEAIGTDSNLYG